VTSPTGRPRFGSWLLPLPAVLFLLLLLALPLLNGAWSFYLPLCVAPLVVLAVVGAVLYAARHARHEPRTALIPLVVCAGAAWLILSGTAGRAVVQADFALNRGLREEVVALVETGQLGVGDGHLVDEAGRSYAVPLPLRYRTAAPHGQVLVERSGGATYVLFPRSYSSPRVLDTGFLYRSDGVSMPASRRRAWALFLGALRTSGALTPVAELAPHWFYVEGD
jgi:hypothetical protein